MPQMSLHWPVDRDGYRIEPSRKIQPSRRTIASGDAVPAQVVRNGGYLDTSCDRLMIAGLYHRLASEPILDFVNRFGLLRKGNSEAVDDFAHAAEVMRSLIEAKERREHPALFDWLEKNTEAIRLTAVPAKEDGKPMMFFRPKSLLDAVYIQFFEDLSTGAQLRLCERPGCGNWFKYGPGTLHRETARYCSPKCQKAHAYSKLKVAK